MSPQLALATAAATLSSAIIAALVALVAAFIQDRKLSFDLFEKRLGAYNELNEAITARIKEIQAVQSILDVGLDTPELRRFWLALRPVRFLFSPKVELVAKRIDAALHDLSMRWVVVLQRREGQPLAAQDAHGLWVACLQKVLKLQDQLYEAVTPALRQETALEAIKNWPGRAYRSARSLLAKRKRKTPSG